MKALKEVATRLDALAEDKQSYDCRLKSLDIVTDRRYIHYTPRSVTRAGTDLAALTLVSRSKKGIAYTALLMPGREKEWACTCPAWKDKGYICSHMAALAILTIGYSGPVVYDVNILCENHTSRLTICSTRTEAEKTVKAFIESQLPKGEDDWDQAFESGYTSDGHTTYTKNPTYHVMYGIHGFIIRRVVLNEISYI